jgi:HAD superfamily hydrolase (TIGR01662 family)
MIRAVIFDLGHTLWDISPGDEATLQAAYDDMRATLAERLRRDDLPDARSMRLAVTAALNDGADTYFANGPILEQPPTHYWVRSACTSLGLDIEDTLLREVTGPLFATEVDRLIVADGSLDTIRALHADGIALGCVTNTLADAATIRLMLRIHGFESYVRSVVVSSEEGYRKPHPSLFAKALRELDVSPREALFVGDSPYHDIGGAKAVGMRAALTTQYVERPWVEGVPWPDARIGHLHELLELTRTLN